MKRLSAFFLAGSLLLLPVTSYYAWDIHNLRKKVQSFITEDTMKLMPAAVIALGLAAGGLYYYLTSKKENPIRSLTPQGYKWPTLEQFQVYSQFNSDGGGGASCGYHALLRGMQVVNAKSKNQDENLLKNDLMNSEIIAHYFGNNGTWRNAIIRRKNDQDNSEWLDDGEVEYLWKNYKKDIISEQVNCGFLAIPDFKVLGTPYSLLEQYIRDEVRPFLNQQKKMFHIFALGTMEQLTDETGTRGHWYPLVMYQNEEGKRKYYIMDSGSWDKTNRLHDVNAWKIINLIEQ